MDGSDYATILSTLDARREDHLQGWARAVPRLLTETGGDEEAVRGLLQLSVKFLAGLEAGGHHIRDHVVVAQAVEAVATCIGARPSSGRSPTPIWWIGGGSVRATCLV
jgi:hypothetical protein